MTHSAGAAVPRVLRGNSISVCPEIPSAHTQRNPRFACSVFTYTPPTSCGRIVTIKLSLDGVPTDCRTRTQQMMSCVALPWLRGDLAFYTARLQTSQDVPHEPACAQRGGGRAVPVAPIVPAIAAGSSATPPGGRDYCPTGVIADGSLLCSSLSEAILKRFLLSCRPQLSPAWVAFDPHNK